jgi:hypothetical protein
MSMIDWATPNRVGLGLTHPVTCAQPKCITILSIYNASAEDLCWRHDKSPSAKAQRAQAERLERHNGFRRNDPKVERSFNDAIRALTPA